MADVLSSSPQGGRRLLQPLLRGETMVRANDRSGQWRGLLGVGDVQNHASILWVRNVLEEMEHARRRQEGDWSEYGFAHPAPKLVKTHSSTLQIKRWDEEDASGDREKYGATEARSERAAAQEEDMGALVTLVAYCDRGERW